MTVDAPPEVARHADLLAGLTARPRSIPSKYFYDDRGSALFDAICDLPEYYPTRTEQRLLDEVAPEVARVTRANELVELGSGTARKTRTLIAALLERGEGLHYAPLDISPYALEQAAAAVSAEFPEVEVTGIVCDYTRSFDALDPDPGCLVAYLGSTIGNFSHVEGAALLTRLRERLAPGDWLLLGVDLVKPVAVLEAAYNDAAAEVTAEFNRNISASVNAEVGADFDPRAFDHLAFFLDPGKSQIEMHLVARREQRVTLPELDLELEIAAGERIRTEVSRKFSRDSAELLLTDAGFTNRRWLASQHFALALATVEAGETTMSVAALPTTEKKRAICGICPAGCWVEVGLEDGELVSIEPEQGHPLGMICRRGQHAPEIVHSEHRLRHPMRRVGPKGTHEFERVSWDEAYEGIVAGMERIKEKHGPEAMSIYTGRGAFELSLCDVYQPKEAAVSSASSVLFPFGSPNTMGVGALCYVSFAMIAPHVTMGRMLVDMYTDIENSDLLLVWGANPATDSPPLDMHRLEAARRRGAEVVVIDPRRSETAVRTEAEWVPIRPGTDGALALGMLNVLIEEELYDEAFARDWTRGFDDLCRYVQHFRPEVVEATTGVPAATVEKLARRIAAAGGAAPIMYTGLEYSNSGIQAIRAVLTLFALAGQLDQPGGIGLAMRDSHFPVNRSEILPNPDLDRAVARDRFPLYSHYRGESHALGLVDAVLRDKPYPIRGLIVHGASILTSWPQTEVWRETLSKLDLMVTIDRQLTADAAYADYVLPATTMFEIDSYMTYGPIFRLREKVVEPVGEARNDYLIMAELARRLGYGELYPQSEEELLEHVLEGSGYTLADVRAAGGTVKLPSAMMEYKKWEKGGLRADGEPGFETPSGKFEIASTLLEDHGYEPLPAYTEPVEGPQARPDLARDFPLVFNSGARRQSYFRSQHHGVKGLAADHPEPLVEIHTDDAAERGIVSGDLVEVATPRSAVNFRAAVTDEIVRGAIECDMGGGCPQGSEMWQSSNVNELTDIGNLDEISGFPVYKCLLAEVAKVDDGDEAARSSAGRATERGACAAGVARFAIVSPDARPERRIYLDNNATTEMAPEVHEAMTPFLASQHGNPSSIYASGTEAHDAVEAARRQVARLLGTKPRRIVFTGGGSESDNLALKGVAFRHAGGRIVTTTVEHPAVLEAAAFLERRGYPVTRLAVDAEGRVEPGALAAALERAADAGEAVRLVSVMLANNEVGTVQPIAELAELAHAYGALFHTDAVQAAGKLPLDVEALGVDLLTLSAHKFHGPKGVGILYVRRGVELEPLVHGGKQEGGLRAGTENVAAIVGAGAAAERARMTALPRMAAVRELRETLHAKVLELVPEARLNGARDDDPAAPRRLPNTLNLTLPDLRGESVVIALDRKGVALSSGSACKSGSPEPSHALLALGISQADAHCAVRFSLSEATTAEEIDLVGAALTDVLEELEATVRFLPCK